MGKQNSVLLCAVYLMERYGVCCALNIFIQGIFVIGLEERRRSTIDRG